MCSLIRMFLCKLAICLVFKNQLMRGSQDRCYPSEDNEALSTGPAQSIWRVNVMRERDWIEVFGSWAHSPSILLWFWHLLSQALVFSFLPQGVAFYYKENMWWLLLLTSQDWDIPRSQAGQARGPGPPAVLTPWVVCGEVLANPRGCYCAYPLPEPLEGASVQVCRPHSRGRAHSSSSCVCGPLTAELQTSHQQMTSFRRCPAAISL